MVTFGSEGDSASAPAKLHDNPGTWLDFTDLVFIDPVGTGFSRARIGDDEAKKQLYNPSADIEYLSRTIYDWLLRNQRMASRKYLTGESYGGYRGPRITHFLQTRLGVAMTFSLFIAGQMIVTLVIDHFGLLGIPEKSISLPRLAGIALITGGVILIRKF